MKGICIYILLTFLVLPAFSKSKVENPVGADMVVAADGTGDFTTLQAAINAAPSNSERRTVIFVKRGTYDTEKLIVPADKINLSLIGESREETVISYHIYDCAGGKCPPEDAAKWTGDNIRTSATLTIIGDGFRAENMTIQNTAGPVGQAQAITVRADKCIFINIDFYGYQDTMYFWSDKKRSYFEGCLVVGRTDYIYGSGTVFFQACEIRSWGGGWITAPSTYKDQLYGFVFNECNITYAFNSPRGGDDGNKVRFGRPWHEYPKVAWLNCEMTEYIHPEGWGDKWNMSYSNTSPDLHLYEYKNTGPGADRSGRANWVGIKELTDEEAANYTVQKVMAGNDGWDPTAEAPLVKSYSWTGNGASLSWLLAENWDPVGVPAKGESALVDSMSLIADGDTFLADLNLKNAILTIEANSTATYISINGGQIKANAAVELNGKIASKGDFIVTSDNVLTLNSELNGVHQLKIAGAGSLILNNDNSNFSGNIIVENGELLAPLSGSLGKGDILVESGGKITIGNDNAFYAKSKLNVVTGAALELNADVTLSEFFINGEIQSVGEYNATTNPDLISGSGKIIIGRPEIFVFHRGDNGNWDNPEHFTPALLPKAGETVIVEEEMETTSTVFEADIQLQGAGTLRLRGDPSKNHTATGSINTYEGTSVKYNTGGAGMYIKAPFTIVGKTSMVMESGNLEGSTLTLAGPVSGSATVVALNNGKGTKNIGNLLLTGDNQNFSGIWDLTEYSNKYPTTEGYITTIEGASENAFGKGKIIVGHQNKVIFNHAKAIGDTLDLTLNESAKAVLNANFVLKHYVLNGSSMPKGEYSPGTHPELYEGNGKIVVGGSDSIPQPEELAAFPGAEGHGKYVTGGRGGRVIYVTNLEDNNSPGSLRYAINQNGARIVLFKVSGTIHLKSGLSISKGDLTIAGQTAPGDGITLRNYPVTVSADNVIIRFMRFRMGDTGQQEGDALGGRFHKNIIIDHCSMSWSTDECVSFYVNENFTLQWCIISESLRNSVHGKGAHGYGGIWGGKNASFHHNLLAHHDSRNPRLGETADTDFALSDLVDMRNNVIYNWQGNSCYGGEAMNVNIVNCYYKPGPATSKKERIASINRNHDAGSPVYNIWGKYYIDGNVLTASERATNDNWTYGVFNQFHGSEGTITEQDKEEIRIDEPHNPGQVTTHTAEKAYEKILEYCGASLKYDSVDMRILKDLSTGTATYMSGGNGSKNGIVDTQDAVGGWPVLASLNAPVDSDDDGMPDAWETAHDLNPYDAGDAQLKSVDGVYPNIEVYINSLVWEIVENQNKDGISTGIGDIEIDRPEPESKMYFSNIEQKLIVSHSERIVNVRVYSITGQLMLVEKTNQNEIKIDASALKNGIYIVSIRDAKNKIHSKKLVKF